MKLIHGIYTATLAVALCVPAAFAQPAPAVAPRPVTNATPATTSTEASSPRPISRCDDVTGVTERTVYLNNVSQQAEANEIVTALRNALSPCDKIYLIPSQGAIVMEAPPDQLALAQKIIADLDRPKKNYRLIYSVTEMDGGKQIGAQDYAMIITSGQTTSLKLGNKVPVATGSTGTNQTSFTYIDIGMNFDATLTEMGNNAMLKSSVEQSSVAPQQSDIAGVKEPIMRQASLRGESLLAPGKPLMLGSLDIPGSTSHLQIEVLMAPLP